MDWSGHVFDAGDVEYVLVANTCALYSVILFGRAITDVDSFLHDLRVELQESFVKAGLGPLAKRKLVPNVTAVVFAKSANRSSIASINNLIQSARRLLLGHELSPRDAAVRLNTRPLKTLGYLFPVEALSKMAQGRWQNERDDAETP